VVESTTDFAPQKSNMPEKMGGRPAVWVPPTFSVADGHMINFWEKSVGKENYPPYNYTKGVWGDVYDPGERALMTIGRDVRLRTRRGIKESDRTDSKMLKSRGQQIVTGEHSKRIDGVWRKFLHEYNNAYECISNEAFTPGRVCEPYEDDHGCDGNGRKHIYVYDTFDRITL